MVSASHWASETWVRAKGNVGSQSKLPSGMVSGWGDSW